MLLKDKEIIEMEGKVGNGTRPREVGTEWKKSSNLMMFQLVNRTVEIFCCLTIKQ
jgi:hypothetical protein